MSERQALLELINKWHETQKWAEALLCEQLKLTDAKDVLEPHNRGCKPIADTGWFYRTHGIGVDIFQQKNKGGIDFDFGSKNLDSFKLREFMIKQLNAGKLTKKYYRTLLQDSEQWDKTFKLVTTET